MNFRLSHGNYEVRGMLEECSKLGGNKRYEEAFNIINSLLEHDQLHQLRGSHPLVDQYKEGPIRFLPTYKYDYNTNIYDTSKKQRTPSWYLKSFCTYLKY